MNVVRTRDELRAALAGCATPRAVVMTMGALHEGHAALLGAARSRAATLVATIFVNPLQFAPGEDLDRYPRTLEADLEMCAREGVDLVFAPTPDVVYPDGDPLVRVQPGPAGERLEGAYRPGHFDGVLTVVLKLLHLVGPDLAFFGEKDAQQLALIRRMVRDLDVAVEVVGVPTVREPDGLALSSRNRYLSTADRAAALSLSRALRAGAAAGPDGPAAVLQAGQAVLDAEPLLEPDYLALVTDPDFTDVRPGYIGPARLVVAGRVGATRLIDNVPVVLGTPTGLKE